jgi:hypothetical protein
LLCKDHERRLKEFEKIKMHPWFKDINWTEIIERKAQKIPYIPDCTEIPATSKSEIEA